MSGRAKTFPASQFAAALLCCTVLAGVPGVALAQDDPAPAQPSPAPTPPPAPAEEGQVIRQIFVAGAQRLEPSTIVSYIKLREGQIYTAAAADEALKDLAATELFASDQTRIEFNNGNVVITIVENPVINRIVLEGNRRLKDDKILPEIKLAPRQIFTRSKVRADVARIIELYKRQGRFAATVEPQMVQLDQNRVDVVFEINEGPKSKVRAINIIGNEAFSDDRIRGEMVTSEAGLLKIFSSSTGYDPDRLAYDQQQVRAFYLSQGYADFRVVNVSAELTQDKRDFIITYVVEEGERYKFGEVAVDSQLRDFSSESLTATLPMRSGDWYDAKMVDDTLEQLTELAGTLGYAFAEAQPQFSRNRETLTMDVRFVLEEAPRVYVERVDVNGNTLTQDKVVRREFRIAEGDAFNSLALERTTARINSLGYFQENFEVDQIEGSTPDRIVLEANVQEQATGELSLSAGFSSLESFIFQGSIRQRNFRGRGQTIGLGLNYSRYSKSANISFTEPYVFDKNISAGIDLYRRDYNNDYYDQGLATYDSSTTGLQARVGVPLSEYVSLLGRYTFNHERITIDENSFFADFDGDGVRECEPLLAGRYLCEALGTRTSSILGMSVVFNSLDSGTRPTRGGSAVASVDLAGLGGTTRYIKFTGEAARYYRVGGGFILSLSAQSGVIKGLKDLGPGRDDVLLTDRFFLGDPEMRGFDIRGVGPRVVRRSYARDDNGVLLNDANNNGTLLPFDDDSTQDDALGGTAFYLARAELEIPLSSGARELGIRPSLFLDVGSVFGIERPQLNQSDFPDGIFIPQRDTSGNALYNQVNFVRPDATETCLPDPNRADAISIVTSPVNPAPPIAACANNFARGSNLPPFVEEFYGNTWKPRVSIGIGVNWNSPFGPFRINIAYPLLKQPGDDTKTFTFGVGTQF